MSYTNGGGTLTLPSPTHGHHVDVGSAVRSLRRSISRSPSKFNLAARTPNSTESPTSSSPSPQSPCRRYSPALTARKSYLQLTPKEKSTPRHETTTAMPTVTTTPSHCPPQPSSSFKPSVKLSLRSARFSKPSQVGSTTPSGPPPRTRASPRSPLKRALSISSDSANSAPSSSSSSDTPGQENSRLPNPASPLSRRCLNKPSRHSLHLDVSGASHSIFRSLDTTTMAAPEFSSPAAGTLKRSDAAMDLETGSLASPVAKRRSLHGIASFSSMAHDNVFDQATPAALNFDIHDDVAQNNYALAGSTIRRETQPSPTPTPSAARRSSSLRKSTLQQRHGDKGSWGRRTGAQQLAQMGAEIPSPSRNRPRLSTDQFVPPPAARDNPFPGGSLFSGSMQNPATTHSTNPHPLSRSLKPSVSGSCFVEDSPIRFEPAPNQAPTRRLDRFKFSLGSSTSSIFSKSLPPAPQTAQLTQTPVVPPPAARSSMFMSSGLVSKVNRDPEEDKRMAVPDTPCKKSSSASFATYPPASAVRFRRGPATPIPFGSPHADRQSTPFSGTGKGLGLFHRLGGRPHRRASVLNLDEENKSSASSRDGASTPEGFPPTPTKSFLTPAVADGGLDRNIIDSPSANRRAPPISAVKPAFSREPSCKYRPSVTVLSTNNPVVLMVCAASPIRPRGSPKTPLDGMLHLDPSRFSISNNGNGSAERYSPVPVTPSTSQGDRRIVTPIHVNKQSRIDIDGHLVERFHSVEEIGRGEFSVVYRVAEPKRVGGSLGLDLGSSPPLAETPPVAPAPGSAFAVKKTRHIFAGPRDRDRKMKEVEILKSLVHAKHVLRFVDSWEMQGHLYIQTEYCDEGTLQGFLNDVGHRGRMDDFRLWKILYDMLLVRFAPYLTLLSSFRPFCFLFLLETMLTH